MMDQAESLRRKIVEKFGKEPEKEMEPVKSGLVKIYAVVSGKGGVGKTNISVNLSIAMAKKERMSCFWMRTSV